MPFNYAQLERRIASLEANRGASLRFGTVTEVNPDTGSARVQLEDGDKMVTWPLRVLQPRSLKDKRQVMPDLGEPVAVLFAGQGLEQGVVLGAQYSTKTPPPAKPASHDYMAYEDGTEIWYDREAHKLVAKVKGELEVEAEGAIRLESQRDITLKAPRISLAGMLRVTDRDGMPGAGELLGTYKIRQGDFFVPDGDVIASAVSLAEHLHDGVESGPDVTGTPVGDSTKGIQNHILEEEAYFNALYKRLPPRATIKDKLLLCLPDIAAVEAEKSWLDHDKKGWLQLRALFYKWFNGEEDNDAESRPDVFWVDMDWALSYARVSVAYNYMIMDEYLFHPNAQQTLAKILLRDELLRDEPTTFDYTSPRLHPNDERPWKEWKDDYFQQTILGNIYLLPIDGLTASIGNASLRALAAGKTVPLARGGHRIIVERVSIFIWDSFNFHGPDGLGYWSCEKKEMSLSNLGDDPTCAFVENKDFENFRYKHGFGKDFMVLSQPQNVAYLPRFEYETEL